MTFLHYLKKHKIRYSIGKRGTITVHQSLALNQPVDVMRHEVVHLLPRRLKVEGDLHLTGPILFLPRYLNVARNFSCVRTKVHSLPRDFHCGGHIDLTSSPILELPFNLKCYGNLNISDTKVGYVPFGLFVNGNFIFSRTKIRDFPLDVDLNGSIIGRGSQLEWLPNRSTIMGDLDLANCCNFCALPNQLTIQGKLNIGGTPVTTIPDDLWVYGDCNCDYSQVETVGLTTHFGGNLSLLHTPFASNPDKLICRRFGGILDGQVIF